MKMAAMTRIHRNEILLKIWLDYYSRYFDTLVVFAGAYEMNKPYEFKELQEKYRFELITIPDQFYSETAHGKVFEKQRELLTKNRWVLYSDADEIVVADPYKYDGLRHFAMMTHDDQTFCEGFDVYQADGELPLDYSKPILQQRSMWNKDTTKSYNKPCLSCIPTDWCMGFHSTRNMSSEEIAQIKDTGLYLVHLKHADPTAEYDFPRHYTGTHVGSDTYKTTGVPIPEKVRRVF